ncbi:unnamed protein product [[Actinomadura] parvosata subsp. kistnae]|nr:hypothetical protein [Nonomuraea sp. ATCC 55076]SPL98978.1 unnamed protein product [Actinomadura parvosata subsp. kistnae]
MPYLWASIVAGWAVLACAGDRLAPVWGWLAQRPGRRSSYPLF